MRLRTLVLLTTMTICAAAQHAGGAPMGHGGGGLGPGKPLPPPFGIGRRPWWGGKRPGFRQPMSFGTAPSWFNTPLCASPLFPLAPDCSWGSSANAPYYPPPVSITPTVNVLVPAAPPMPPPIGVTTAPGAEDLSSPSQDGAAAAANLTNSDEVSRAGSGGYQQAPPRSQGAQDGCPPLIVLKTGGMYSITKYWIKGKTLYFETTAGDTLYSPLSVLERIIPGR